MTDICGHCAGHTVQLKGFIRDVLGSPDRPSWNLKKRTWSQAGMAEELVAEPTPTPSHHHWELPVCLAYQNGPGAEVLWTTL